MKFSERTMPFFFVGDTTKLSAERRAVLQMFGYFHKATILDDLNNKALDRAGNVGKAVRELFEAIDVMIEVEGGKQFREIIKD